MCVIPEVLSLHYDRVRSPYCYLFISSPYSSFFIGKKRLLVGCSFFFRVNLYVTLLSVS